MNTPSSANMTIEPNSEQLAFLAQMGGEITCSDEAMENMFLVIRSGRAQVVGSNLVGRECSAELFNTLHSHPYNITGSMFTGIETTVHPDVQLRGCFVRNANIGAVATYSETTILGGSIHDTQLESHKDPSITKLTFNGVLIEHFTDGKLVYIGNELANLTSTEYELLAIFLEAPEATVFSKRALLNRLYKCSEERPYIGDSHVIDVHISNIRIKLRALGLDELIVTRYGKGWMRALQRQAEESEN